MSKKVTRAIPAIVFMASCLIMAQPQKAQAAQEIPICSADDLRQMEPYWQVVLQHLSLMSATVIIPERFLHRRVRVGI